MLTTALSVGAVEGISCQLVYGGDPALKPMAAIVADKENPFDVARLNRSANPLGSSELLAQVEKLLLTDIVVSVEPLGGGVTASYKVKFASGLKGVFKPVNPERANQPTREAVAYRLSELMQLDIVPPTVVRTLSGENVPAELQNQSGSIQLFVQTADTLKKGTAPDKRKIVLLNGQELKVDEILSGRRLRIFDWLINNHDRGSNAGNYLVAKSDGYIFGIDHSVSFVGHDKQAREDKVPYYTPDFLKDREFYNKLTAVSKDQIRQALSGLNPVRIDEFMQRYDRLIADFQKALGI